MVSQSPIEVYIRKHFHLIPKCLRWLFHVSKKTCDKKINTGLLMADSSLLRLVICFIFGKYFGSLPQIFRLVLFLSHYAFLSPNKPFCFPELPNRFSQSSQSLRVKVQSHFFYFINLHKYTCTPYILNFQ